MFSHAETSLCCLCFLSPVFFVVQQQAVLLLFVWCLVSVVSFSLRTYQRFYSSSSTQVLNVPKRTTRNINNCSTSRVVEAQHDNSKHRPSTSATAQQQPDGSFEQQKHRKFMGEVSRNVGSYAANNLSSGSAAGGQHVAMSRIVPCL